MENLTLYELTENFKELEEMDVESTELEPYLDSIQLQINDKINNIVKFRQNLTATASAIDNEILRLSSLKKQRERLSERLKGYIAYAMQQHDIKKIDSGIFKLSFLKSTAVVVDDSKLDEKYLITKITKQADKISIKKALQAGEIIQGAILQEKLNLQIK